MNLYRGWFSINCSEKLHWSSCCKLEFKGNRERIVNNIQRNNMLYLWQRRFLNSYIFTRDLLAIKINSNFCLSIEKFLEDMKFETWKFWHSIHFDFNSYKDQSKISEFAIILKPYQESWGLFRLSGIIKIFFSILKSRNKYYKSYLAWNL